MRYVTTGGWGAGLGRPLTPSEIDGNFFELVSQVNDLISNPLQPVSIASVSASGNQLTFNMSDGSTVGPIYLPVLTFRWRDEWTANTSTEVLDIFKVSNVGLYLTLQNHITAVTFDKARQIDGSPAYLELFAFAPPVNYNEDFGFCYPGRLADITSDIVYLYQEPFTRRIILPVTPFNGAQHQVYIQTPASTNAQDLIVYANDGLIGSIHIPTSSNAGVLTLNQDTTFEIGGRLAVGTPAVSDSVAAGLSVMFAGQLAIS